MTNKKNKNKNCMILEKKLKLVTLDLLKNKILILGPIQNITTIS